MTETALFGPGGNSDSFYESGRKHTYEAFEWLKTMGLDAYELQGGNGITGSAETYKKIGSEAEKYGVRLSVHAPYYISLSGTDAEKRLNSIGYIKKSDEAAVFMNADIIVIHAGSASKIGRAEALDYARDTLYKALETIPDSGVKWGLETMGKINQLGTLEEVLELCALDRRLCPVVDFGHLNARGAGNVFAAEDDYRRIFDVIGSTLSAPAAKKLHCHFSKIEYTQAGEKKHLTFADNVYGPAFEPLMEAIVRERLSPRIICESDGTMAEDALTMKRYYLKLSESTADTDNN